MSAQANADVLLVGCGDLGTRIGRLLVNRGYTVAAMRRRADLVPAPLMAVAVDLTGDEPVTEVRADLLVVALTADQRDEAGYRRVYVDGMRRAIEAMTPHEGAPRRAVLVSSTGVHGDGDGWVDESSPPAPVRATSRVLLEAEEAFRAALPGGVVARLSGLYGGASPRLVRQVRAGENPDPGRWGNRVHRQDAARAVVHLLCEVAEPEPTYLVSDDEPATNADVRAFVAAELGVHWPPAEARVSASAAVRAHGKRLSNATLRSTGFAFDYPTYREGYRALLGEQAIER